jgi:hypothetical protein
MFSITAETCRRFTLAEILIMAALNVETIGSQSSARAKVGGDYGIRKF